MRLLAILALLAAPAQAFAWGDTGHKLIVSVAAELAGKPWATQADSLAALSLVPDWQWKSPEHKKVEGPTHFFDLELYAPSPGKLGEVPREFAKARAKYGAEVIDRE